ncbi:MAG: DUF5667 domain-containing protein [Minisyncoccia bacterium]
MKENNFYEGIQGIQKGIRLSPEEKGAVLARLIQHVDAHNKQQPIISPWKIYVSRFNFRFQFQYAIAGILILLLTGGSVTFAAEGALPGDLLYPVKIHVAEPLQGALVSGDVGKAQWQAQVAVRRLEEAETLAAQGRLSASSVQTVRDNFQNSVNRFNTAIADASAKSSSDDIVNAAVDFEADINAHSQILSVVGNTATSSLASNIASLRSVVDENAQRAKEHRVSAADAFLKDSSQGESISRTRGDDSTSTPRTSSNESGRTKNQKSFNDRVQAVQTIIRDTRILLNDTATSTTVASSSIQQDIREHTAQTLQTAENALKDAEQKQRSGDSNDAFSALLDSESAAKTADTSFQRGVKLDNEQRTSQQSQQSDSRSRSDSRTRSNSESSRGGESD